jgi:hypothetical protein
MSLRAFTANPLLRRNLLYGILEHETKRGHPLLIELPQKVETIVAELIAMPRRDSRRLTCAPGAIGSRRTSALFLARAIRFRRRASFQDSATPSRRRIPFYQKGKKQQARSFQPAAVLHFRHRQPLPPPSAPRSLAGTGGSSASQWDSSVSLRSLFIARWNTRIASRACRIVVLSTLQRAASFNETISKNSIISCIAITRHRWPFRTLHQPPSTTTGCPASICGALDAHSVLKTGGVRPPARAQFGH